MDRYTAREPEGNAYYPKCFEEECFGMESREECEKCQFTFDVCERLAAYEDLGLLPEQLRELDGMYKEVCEKLAEYQKLEEQGLMLRLPCKVGDTVYVIPTEENGLKGIAEMECLGFSIGEPYNTANLFPKNRLRKDVPKMYQPCIKNFGKTVFLSEAEAQKALKRLEEV